MTTTESDDLSADRSRAEALLQMRRFAEAERAVREALTRHPADASLACILARCLLHQRRYEEALAATGDALANSPEYALAYRVRAEILYEQSANSDSKDVRATLLNQAAECSEKALELDPLDASGHSDHARNLSKLGRHTWAWNAAIRGTELNPSDPHTWSMVGLVAFNSDDLATAEAAFRKALELDPTYYQALNNLGACLIRQRRRHEAAKVLREAARIAPTESMAVENLAIIGSRPINIALLILLAPMAWVGIAFYALGTSLMRTRSGKRLKRRWSLAIAQRIAKVPLPRGSTLVGVGLIAWATAILLSGSASTALLLLVISAFCLLWPVASHRRHRGHLARVSFTLRPMGTED